MKYKWTMALFARYALFVTFASLVEDKTMGEIVLFGLMTVSFLIDAFVFIKFVPSGQIIILTAVVLSIGVTIAIAMNDPFVSLYQTFLYYNLGITAATFGSSMSR